MPDDEMEIKEGEIPEGFHELHEEELEEGDEPGEEGLPQKKKNELEEEEEGSVDSELIDYMSNGLYGDEPGFE